MAEIRDIKPLPYQEEAMADIAVFDGRALLAFDMGLGKTLTSLWTLVKNDIDTWPAIVLCPAGVKLNWKSNIVGLGLRCYVAEGRTPPRRFKSQLVQNEVILLNYDIVYAWCELLCSVRAQTLIMDECHYLCNRDTQRYKAAKKIAKTTRNVIGLSGTPFTNRPAELWPILNMIRPDLYKGFTEFAYEYCAPRRTPWGWDFSGASNMRKLNAELKRNLMIRVLKKDVLDQLPEKNRRIIPIELMNRSEYVECRDNFMQWLKRVHPERVESAKKSESLTKIGYLLRLCAKLKLKGVVEWCNQFLEENPNEKLVIFAVHTKMIEAMDRRIEGGDHILIYGDVDMEKRHLSLEKFKKDPNCRVAIGNIQAMGTGVDGLQEAASTSVIVELPWHPGVLNQLEDRTHRIGQKNKAWYYYLIAGETIEERLCSLLQSKQEIIRTAIDGGMLQEDLNIHDELQKAIYGERKTLKEKLKDGL